MRGIKRIERIEDKVSDIELELLRMNHNAYHVNTKINRLIKSNECSCCCSEMTKAMKRGDFKLETLDGGKRLFRYLIIEKKEGVIKIDYCPFCGEKINFEEWYY